MKTWNQLHAQACRIMLNCQHIERTNKGFVYYVIGSRKYKRSDLIRLAIEVAQKRYGLSRFEIREKSIDDYLREWRVKQ